jgi:hypothetical protein
MESVLAGGCGRPRYASELERVDLKMLSILLQKLAKKIQTFAGQRSMSTTDLGLGSIAIRWWEQPA